LRKNRRPELVGAGHDGGKERGGKTGVKKGCFEALEERSGLWD